MCVSLPLVRELTLNCTRIGDVYSGMGAATDQYGYFVKLRFGLGMCFLYIAMFSFPVFIFVGRPGEAGGGVVGVIVAFTLALGG